MYIIASIFNLLIVYSGLFHWTDRSMLPSHIWHSALRLVFSLSAYMRFPATSLSPFLSIEILERGDVTRKILTSPPKTEPTTAPLFPNTHNKCKIDRPSATDSREQNNISKTRCATGAAQGYDSKHLCQKSVVVYVAILLFCWHVTYLWERVRTYHLPAPWLPKCLPRGRNVWCLLSIWCV